MDVSHNSIISIDEESLLLAPSLTNLILHHNKIVSVSASDIQSLRSLDLSHNGMSHVPAGLPSLLTHLNLSHNTLTHPSLPLLSHLTHLHLSFNPVQLLTPDMFSLASASLVSLSLVSTPLTSLPTSTLASLHQLKYLDLSGTLIHSLAPGDLNMMLHLTHITITSCPNLSKVLASSLPSVTTHLNISLNPHLSTIHPEALTESASIISLDIQSNNLTTLSIPASLPHLQKLSAEDNPWRCDCQLRNLQTHLVKLSSRATCSEPSEYKNLDIRRVTQLQCGTSNDQREVNIDTKIEEESYVMSPTFLFTIIGVIGVLIVGLLISLSTKRILSLR